MQDIYEFFHYINGDPLLFWSWFGGIAFVIFVLMIYLIRREPKEIVAFDASNGRTTIARSAIVNLIQKAASSAEGIKKANVKIKTRRGRLRYLRLKVHLKAEYRLREVDNYLRRRIADALRLSFGLEDTTRINVRVVQSVGDPRPLLPEDHPRQIEEADYKESREPPKPVKRDEQREPAATAAPVWEEKHSRGEEMREEQAAEEKEQREEEKELFGPGEPERVKTAEEAERPVAHEEREEEKPERQERPQAEKERPAEEAEREKKRKESVDQEEVIEEDKDLRERRENV